MNEDRDSAYLTGYAAAWRKILNECTRALHMTDPEAQAAAFLEERQATIAYLRDACAGYGDNDWPDDLYLPDIIEKHLMRHME